MGMLRTLLVSTFFVTVAAAPPGATESCAAAGGACEEAEIEVVEEGEAELLRMELLQQAVHTKRDAAERLSQASNIEFSLAKEEFARVGELVPEKLLAAGLPMAEFVPRFLAITTAAGSELRANPLDADFPLHFRYEPQPEGPQRRKKTAQALGQDSSAFFLSRRRRSNEVKPEYTSYQATDEEVDLEVLATNVYNYKKSDNKKEDPLCWKLDEGHSFTDPTWGGKDKAAIYKCTCNRCMTTPVGDGVSNLAINTTVAAVQGKKAKSCVLAISGTNDLFDWSNNLDAVWNGEFCGKDKYHRGFSDETDFIVSQPQFASLATNMKTCDRLIVTGHSLGGAVASMVAECINCQDCKKPAALQGIGAEAELYTFGAPAVYEGEPPSNGHSPTGIFKGRRFWNYDMRSCVHRFCASWCCWSLGNQDPVPYVAQKVGYLHPKIESVGLDEHGQVEVWMGSSDVGVSEPDSFQWPSVAEHLNSNYVARIRMHLKE